MTTGLKSMDRFIRFLKEISGLGLSGTLAVAIICLSVLSSCSEDQTEVIICSSLHGLHKSNPNYSYENLFGYINAFDPDVIGLEIREEDVDSSSSYLKKYYPLEMYEIRDRNSSKIVYGIDWLGAQIEGKPIPEGYFGSLEVLQLSSKADADSIFQSRLSGLNELAELKDDIARNSSIAELNDGRYDSLNTLYYETLNNLYQDTPYRKVAEFYMNRDVRITERLLDIVDENRGKKLIFIVGADHRSRAIDSFNEKFKGDASVKLLNVH